MTISKLIYHQLNNLTSGIDAACQAINPFDLDKAAGVLLDTRRRGKVIFLCGNGGSAGLANHAACDLGKAGMRVISLGASPEILTAAGNDDGYENVFLVQLEMLAKDGDTLMAISSSGRSPNIAKALDYATSHGMQTISLTGFTGGEARQIADVNVHVEAEIHDYGVVETAHQAILHALAAYVKAKWSAETA